MVGKWFSYIQHLIQKADPTLAKVADDSVIAQLLAKNGDVSAYKDTQHSLQAIAENAAPASVLGALDATGATGAVSDSKTAMAYIKQLTTNSETIAGDVANLDGDAMRGTDDAALASVLGALNTTGATGAISDADTAMAYAKQLVTLLLNSTYGLSNLQVLIAALQTDLDNGTDGLGALKTLLNAIPTTAMRGTDDAALASVLGALDTTGATGAVSDVKAAMAYLKQIATNSETIASDVVNLDGDAMRGTDSAALASVLGALDTTGATGAVTDADSVMAYAKQLIINSELLVEHETHITRILPESTANHIVLAAPTGADTWSAWAEIADDQGSPDTLSSKFASNSGHITAMLVEDADTGGTLYMVEISYGASNTIVSRHRVLTETNKLPTAQVSRERGHLIPAGETIYYRCMCETEGNKTLNAHFRYFLH